MKVSEALANAVTKEGVTALFGLMGDGNMFFLERLLEGKGTRIFNARHEASAVSMADGYARATGGVGVATVTCGPGVTQLGTSLTVASRHGTPLVIIGGDVPNSMKGMDTHIQDTDQRAFVQASGALFHQLRGAETAGSDVAYAFWLARKWSKPVFLNCPIDVQDLEVKDERPAVSPARAHVADRSVPSSASIDKAVDMLASSTRPVLVAGAGAAASGSRDLIEKIGDQVGAALATTLRAKGYLHGPWAIGVCGTFSTDGAAAILAAADLVVLIGVSGSNETAEAIPRSARTLHINTASELTIGGRIPDSYVVGDAKIALETIYRLLSEGEFTSPGFRTTTYRPQFAADPVEADLEQAVWETGPDTLDPRLVIRQLNSLLPDECSMVIGAGHFWSFPIMFLTGQRNRRFFTTYDFGCIGQAVPTAFGVSVALPDSPVIVFEGDASVMMHIHEFDTIARYCPRMLVFIMNDGALGAEYHKLRMRNLDPRWSLIPTPQFGRLAEAFGNAGGLVTSIDQLEAEVAKFEMGSLARFVDVRISTAVVSPTYRVGEASQHRQPPHSATAPAPLSTP